MTRNDYSMDWNYMLHLVVSLDEKHKKTPSTFTSFCLRIAFPFTHPPSSCPWGPTARFRSIFPFLALEINSLHFGVRGPRARWKCIGVLNTWRNIFSVEMSGDYSFLLLFQRLPSKEESTLTQLGNGLLSKNKNQLSWNYDTFPKTCFRLAAGHNSHSHKLLQI